MSVQLECASVLNGGRCEIYPSSNFMDKNETTPISHAQLLILAMIAITFFLYLSNTFVIRK